MDLNIINTEYKFLKNNLYFLNGNIDQIEAEINKCSSEVLHYEEIINQANSSKTNVNDWAKEGAEKNLKLAKQQLRELKELLETRKIELEYVKDQIDSKLAELKQDPEMKRHINDVLTLKYERRIKALNKQGEEELKNSKEAKKLEDLKTQKDTISKMQQLIEDHPSVANNIKGIIDGAIALNKEEKDKKEGKTIDTTDKENTNKYENYKKKLTEYDQNLKDAKEGKKTKYVFTPSQAEEARKFVELYENTKNNLTSMLNKYEEYKKKLAEYDQNLKDAKELKKTKFVFTPEEAEEAKKFVKSFENSRDPKGKIEKNEILLEIVANKSKIEITAHEIINQLNRISLKPNIEIDTNKILSEYMRFLDMKIEKVSTELYDRVDAIDASVKRNKIALENISRSENTTDKPQTKQKDNNREKNTKSGFKSITKGYNKQEYEKEKKDRGIGFFNFIKKYKLRKELINRPALNEPELSESRIREVGENQQRRTLSKEENSFKDGLKYEIVQEYIKQEQERVENIELDNEEQDNSDR